MSRILRTIHTLVWACAAALPAHAQDPDPESFFSDTRTGRHPLGETAGYSREPTHDAPQGSAWWPSTPASERDPVRFEGTVTGFREVYLQRREEAAVRHSFFRLQLKNSDNRVVSLGTRLRPDDIGLGESSRVRVEGRTAKIDGRKFLIADRIAVDGRTYEIPPRRQFRQVTLEGRLEGFRSLDLSDREQHLILRLRLQDGTRRIVDLGRGTPLADLNLDRGDRLRVTGPILRIDGREVLVARRLVIDGERQWIR